MAEYNNCIPNLQGEGYGAEGIDNTYLYGGMETGATNSTTGALALHPGPFPEASQPSMTPVMDTFRNGKPKLHSMEPIPSDPNLSKRVKKAKQSKKNREGKKMQTQNLKSSVMGLKEELDKLDSERMTLEKSVNHLNKIKEKKYQQ